MAKFYYKLIADFLMIVHILWLALLVGGTVFIFLNRWYIPYHLTLIGGTAFLNLLFRGCPLTWLEEKYRKAWDPSTFYRHNSFAATYVEKFFGVNTESGWVSRLQVVAKIISFTLSILLLTGVL